MLLYILEGVSKFVYHVYTCTHILGIGDKKAKDQIFFFREFESHLRQVIFLWKSLPRVSLNCVVLLCILEGVSKFVYHVYTCTRILGNGDKKAKDQIFSIISL